jgi:hypothetical protein
MVCNFIKRKKNFLLLNFFSSTCASGQWSCTQLDCSHTCSILRNRYYTTFSGQYLQINSGSCAYTAARFREDAKQFALTLSDSVPTEYVHSLQGQLTIDGILSRILFF